mmetsp:Transcript_121602/g.236595  ORF Transcript_121602/g.236595 Transcript_121602/m.236595 type:complete len:217 (+) Transcript_121602:82-732(+)
MLSSATDGQALLRSHSARGNKLLKHLGLSTIQNEACIIRHLPLHPWTLLPLSETLWPIHLQCKCSSSFCIKRDAMFMKHNHERWTWAGIHRQATTGSATQARQRRCPLQCRRGLLLLVNQVNHWRHNMRYTQCRNRARVQSLQLWRPHGMIAVMQSSSCSVLLFPRWPTSTNTCWHLPAAGKPNPPALAVAAALCTLYPKHSIPTTPANDMLPGQT